MDFSKNIPKYLVEKGNQVRLVIFTAIFSLVFINVFEPYGSRDWLKDGDMSDAKYLALSSLLVLIGMVVVSISRIIFYYHCVSLRRPVALWAYLLWIAAEIVAISFSFTILEIFLFYDTRDFSTLMRISFRNTSCILLLPYTLTWLYFSWRDKDRRLKVINGYRQRRDDPDALDNKQMVNFFDSKGELKLAINVNDLFYIKGADNYLTVHYRDGLKNGSSMIRGTFKSIEDDMREKGIIRCHRSYMVNRRHVRIFEKSKDGFIVKLDTVIPTSIPVSKNYSQDVFELFGQ